MVVFAEFTLRTDCAIKTGESGGVPVYTEYEEDGRHKPFNLSTSDPEFVFRPTSNSLSFSSCTPRKGRELSEIELPVDWETFTGLYGTDGLPRFILAKFDYPYSPAGVPSHTIYGWVDSAEPVATKGPSTNTRIRWHVDYWITTASIINWKKNDPTVYSRVNISFGEGRITRGPSSTARPDPSSPRKWEIDANILLGDIHDTMAPWVIVLFTSKDGSGGTTFNYAWWPLRGLVGNYQQMSILQIYTGLIEECMGIDPDSIVGIWFSPIRPIDHTQHGAIWHHNYQGVEFGWYQAKAGMAPPEMHTINQVLQTDDRTKYVITDPMGTVYGTLPWGVYTDSYLCYVDVGTAGAFLNVDFKENGSIKMGEGRHIQMPLISAPVTSNALSSYVYSGQQEYDREMARTQQEQNAKSGIAGVGTSAIGGAIAGSMVAPGAGTVLGLAGGAVSSLLGTAANYFIQGETDRKTQEATDRLMSNQTANAIISGGSQAWYHVYGGSWRILKLVRDAVSDAEIEEEQDELGYVTDAYRKNCQSLIEAGGPLRIEGLRVKGDVSPEGRAYISAMFSRGVYIDLIL